MAYTCPVCGFAGLEEKPRDPAAGGSYEICPSCGFQFGVTDDDRGITYEEWRSRWVADGLRWNSEGIEPPPANWDPRGQLERLLSDQERSD